jgi:hypothetical protein
MALRGERVASHRHFRPTFITSSPLALQVSFDWQLDSTIVFKAVAYLDNYLSQHVVEQLSR